MDGGFKAQDKKNAVAFKGYYNCLFILKLVLSLNKKIFF